MDIGDLLIAVAGCSLADAADRFAQAGIPVFPCVRGEKRPLTEHGFHEATVNSRTVSAWWRRWPAANIGIPTGHASGVDVVDVDRKPGGTGFPWFDRAGEAGLIPGWAALVRTPSGGMHAYFPADPERRQLSWQAARAHIDFRGDGGYVVAPPSAVARPEGGAGQYVRLDGATTDPAPVDAGALRDFLDPRPATSFRPHAGPVRGQDAQRLAGWVAALGEGERNRGLFWAACRLAEAGMAPSGTLDALLPAAERAGLPPREVFVTIRSAYRTVGSAPPRPDGHAFGGDADPPRRARATGRVLS